MTSADSDARVDAVTALHNRYPDVDIKVQHASVQGPDALQVENVRRFVNYLVSTNSGEVLVVFFGVLLGSLLFPARFSGASQALILTPILILWINLVVDTLPALALGADPHADGLMDRPPRPTDEGVINTRVLVSILTISVLLAVTGLGIFF